MNSLIEPAIVLVALALAVGYLLRRRLNSKGASPDTLACGKASCKCSSGASTSPLQDLKSRART